MGGSAGVLCGRSGRPPEDRWEEPLLPRPLCRQLAGALASLPPSAPYGCADEALASPRAGARGGGQTTTGTEPAVSSVT